MRQVAGPAGSDDGWWWWGHVLALKEEAVLKAGAVSGTVGGAETLLAPWLHLLASIPPTHTQRHRPRARQCPVDLAVCFRVKSLDDAFGKVLTPLEQAIEAMFLLVRLNDLSLCERWIVTHL